MKIINASVFSESPTVSDQFKVKILVPELELEGLELSQALHGQHLEGEAVQVGARCHQVIDTSVGDLRCPRQPEVLYLGGGTRETKSDWNI